MEYNTKEGMVYDSTGNVAVLYSKAYKYKWNTVSKEHRKAIMFYPPLVYFLLLGGNPYELVDNYTCLSLKGKELVQDLFKDTEKYSYLEDLKNLAIEWVPVGKMIRVTDVDGYEKIECFDEVDWIEIPK